MGEFIAISSSLEGIYQETPNFITRMLNGCSYSSSVCWVDWIHESGHHAPEL